LAVAVTVIVALSDPVALLTVNQVWLLPTFQLIFEVISNVAVLFAADATFSVVAETDKDADDANCVTIIVCDATPLPETVTVALR
jgi:hypothetical protein